MKARNEDKARIDSYMEQLLKAFHGFKIPMLGRKRRERAELALKNFSRNPDTKLYHNTVDGTDTHKVSLIQRPYTVQA